MFNHYKSQALIAVVLVMFITFGIGAAFLFYSRSVKDVSHIQSDSAKAYSLAKSGLDRAAQCIYQDPCTCNILDQTIPLGGGTFTINIAKDSALEFDITSTGKYGGSSRVLKETIRLSNDELWLKRIPINISNAGTTSLTNYQAWIPWTIFSAAQQSDIKGGTGQADLDDVRFVKYSGQDKLPCPYYIEGGTTTPSGFWVNVPSVPMGNSTIYMYYGNAYVSAGQNVDDAFDYFDDFEKGNLNKWTLEDLDGGGAGNWYIYTGDKHSGTYSSRMSDYNWGVWASRMISKKSFNYDMIYEVWFKSYTADDDFFFQFNFTDFNNSYRVFYDAGDTYRFELRKGIGGVFTVLALKTTGLLNDALKWLRMTVIRKSNGDIIVQVTDGVSTIAISANDNSITQAAPISISALYNFGADDVRVRRYASPEPTTTAGATESCN